MGPPFFPVKHPQIWLIFFGIGSKTTLLERLFFKKGWRHVAAASFDPELSLWLYVNPARDRTYVLMLKPAAFERFFAKLREDATAILEFHAMSHRRKFQSLSGGCCGVVKGIVGVPSWAMSPRGLYRDLVRHGAESFGREGELSQPADYGQSFWWRRRTSAGSAGRSLGRAGPADCGGARASGPDQGNAVAVEGRDRAQSSG